MFRITGIETKLQLGRRSSATEMSRGAHRPPRRLRWLQLGRRSSATEIPTWQCGPSTIAVTSFNWAVALQRRRYAGMTGTSAESLRLQLGRRSSATEIHGLADALRLFRRRFNWAVALQRRRFNAFCDKDNGRTLQLGRRSSATEIPQPRGLLRVREHPASIGPSLFSDGDSMTCPPHASSSAPLQLGRRSSATEIPSFIQAQQAAFSELQLGRRSSATEIRLH